MEDNNNLEQEVSLETVFKEKSTVERWVKKQRLREMDSDLDSLNKDVCTILLTTRILERKGIEQITIKELEQMGDEMDSQIELLVKERNKFVVNNKLCQRPYSYYYENDELFF
jgi:type III secretory pathway component EscV